MVTRIRNLDLNWKYPEVVFTGPKFFDDFAAHHTSGDVFVFPSLTDTFGLVILEAMASGLPVAAFPATGPFDELSGAKAAFTDANLSKAVDQALQAPAKQPHRNAKKYGWDACTD